MLNWIDVNGRVILNHPQLPAEVKSKVAKYTEGTRERSLSKPLGEKESSEQKEPKGPPKTFLCEEEEPQIDLKKAGKQKLKQGQKYSVKDLVKEQEADCLIVAIKSLMNDD